MYNVINFSLNIIYFAIKYEYNTLLFMFLIYQITVLLLRHGNAL